MIPAELLQKFACLFMTKEGYNSIIYLSFNCFPGCRKV